MLKIRSYTPEQRAAWQELHTQRQLVCSECEHMRLGLCTQCGCVVHFKTTMDRSECPLDRWPKPEEWMWPK